MFANQEGFYNETKEEFLVFSQPNTNQVIQNALNSDHKVRYAFLQNYFHLKTQAQMESFT